MQYGIARIGTRLSGSRYPGPGGAGDILQGRDVGSVGPHRSSWGGLAIDICPHPYALRKLKPSMSRASSGSANPNAKTARTRKKTVVRRALLPQLERNPIPPLPPSSTTVEGGEVLGTRGEHTGMRTPASQAIQDSFKSLAGSAGKPKLGKRKPNAVARNFLPNSLTALPGPSTRKRAREENDPSTLTDLSPPPSKKHRRGASVGTTIRLNMGKTPTAILATQKAPTTLSLTDTGRSRKRTAALRAPSPQPQCNATLNSKKHRKGRTLVISEGKKIGMEADSVREEWKDRKETTLEDIGLGEESIWVQDEKTRRGAEAKVISQASSPPRWKDDPPSRLTRASLPSRRRKRLPPAIDDEEPGNSHKLHRVAAPSTNNLSSSTPLRACQQDGRVFAPWLGEYYSATVEDSWKKDDVTVCSVRFDNNVRINAPLKSLYYCELREGDKVKVPGPKGEKLGRDGYASAVPLWEDRYKVSVRLVTTSQEEVANFDWKNIAVVADFVWKEWEDRKVMSLEDIGLGEEHIRMKEEKERKERKEAEAKRHRTIPLIFL